MIHEDNMHHFNKIILYSMFKTTIPVLLVDIIIMPLQAVTGYFFLRIINFILPYKLELLAKCCTQEAHKSNVNNLLQLTNTNVITRLHVQTYANFSTVVVC